MWFQPNPFSLKNKLNSALEMLSIATIFDLGDGNVGAITGLTRSQQLSESLLQISDVMKGFVSLEVQLLWDKCVFFLLMF